MCAVLVLSKFVASHRHEGPYFRRHKKPVDKPKSDADLEQGKGAAAGGAGAKDLSAVVVAKDARSPGSITPEPAPAPGPGAVPR